jgi:hypothetical protein
VQTEPQTCAGFSWHSIDADIREKAMPAPQLLACCMSWRCANVSTYVRVYVRMYVRAYVFTPCTEDDTTCEHADASSRMQVRTYVIRLRAYVRT